MTTDTIRTPNTAPLWEAINLLGTATERYSSTFDHIQYEIANAIWRHQKALSDLAWRIDDGET